MGRTYKLLISGPVGSGKSTFIRSVSEIPVVDTDVISTIDIGKERTTVAMDYGLIHIGDDEIHLFGTPGQVRFSFMWDILSNGAVGFIMLVDSTNPSEFPKARQILDYVTSRTDIPFIVGATKQDIKPSWDIEFIAEYFELEVNLVRPLLAIDRVSSLRFLEEFFETYLRERR